MTPSRHLSVVPAPRRLHLVPANVVRLPLRRPAGCPLCAVGAPGHGEAA